VAHPDRVALALECDFADPDPRTWTRASCELTAEQLELLEGFSVGDMDAVVSLLRTDLELAKAESLARVTELGRMARTVLRRLQDDPTWLA
jgi:hypothetical protein